MIYLLLSLCVTGLFWLILHFRYSENVSVLGFTPFSYRLFQFCTGLFIGTSVVVILTGIHTILYKSQWIHVSITSYERYLTVFWEQFTYVILMEITFRGAILYLLLKYFKPLPAVLISALAFTLFEIRSYDLNLDYMWPPLLKINRTLLLGGVLGYSFYRSGSILPAIGIHLAWLFTNALFYPANPSGQLLFFEMKRTMEVHWTLAISGTVIYDLLTALLMLMGVHYLLRTPKPIRYIEINQL